MVSKSTLDTENYKPIKKLNLPRTEQINFNKALNDVIKKYKTNNPQLYNNLRTNICSEPMPCSVYCLPKDHKEGDLKGRPTDTPATKLSKYLAKELNTLLCYVPAHLRNTTDFIEFLNDFDRSSICGFCSLDICNLYGSIPIPLANRHSKPAEDCTEKSIYLNPLITMPFAGSAECVRKCA